MKVMSPENHNTTSSHGNSNSSSTATWLEFSLSPQLKFDLTSSITTTNSPDSSSPQESAAFNSPFLSPHQVHPPICFDVSCTAAETTAAGCFLSLPPPPSPLSVMPLRSDGSLCIMEAFSRSQPPSSQEPKVENFLGGETMGLSLDSHYYNQNAEGEKQHQQYESFLSALACQGYYQQQAGNDQCHVAENLVVSDGGGGGGFGVLQSLSLSMSPGSQYSCVTASQMSISPPSTIETKKRGFGKVCQNTKQTVHRKSIDTFGQRTSQFRGVTKHRWTGRYEAHLWDNSCKKEGQTRKGRQVYLGGYDMEEKAARAYDLAALRYWGLSTHTNFPIENYKDEIEEMKHMTRQEYVAHLRRKSSGFSRGASMYRGVTRHHQHGRWQARIGRVAGNKDLYLGTFSTQEEAAEAYDVAAIKFRGSNAVTNFDISRYDVEKIMSSNALLAGEQAKRTKLELTEAFDHLPSSETSPGWKSVSEHQASSACIEPSNPKPVTLASFNNPLFPLGLQDLACLDQVANPTQATGEDSAKLGSAHFSNPSSLVTSLNSSREGSPDRTDSSLQLASKLVGPTSTAWITPVAQLPVFAAWSDI